ncbi:hypothetical protein HHI36_003194 [Cryptolaemus montrouzieri]|uniref:Uncharacterized protein n=1 Tax=Cryptolaemus montrouzieri TaxID=559131 RepID=A0ABD2PD92_9CUCU
MQVREVQSTKGRQADTKHAKASEIQDICHLNNDIVKSISTELSELITILVQTDFNTTLRSTVTAVRAGGTRFLQGISTGEKMSLLYDHSKAFDTICQEMLLKKVGPNGFRGRVYDLLECFFSDPTKMKYGVPQQFVVESIHHLSYTNDVDISGENQGEIF